MTQVEELAAFVTRASYNDLSDQARLQVKIRILDALGCALGALGGAPIRAIRAQLEDFGGAPRCSLIGGGKSAPDQAALLNSALVRYLDFNDSYLAKGETCHPSDNLGAILAGSEYAQKTGRDLMTALAVAYQVQCRLSDAAPVRAKGFDHTTQGAYAVAAGVSKALGLNPDQTANAIAISGTALNALRVTRTGKLSNWKGLAYPYTAFGATEITFLAMRGITGPLEVFEGNKGFIEAIAGPFEVDWQHEDLERVTRTIVKKYNAEIHSQSALEGTFDLLEEHPFEAGQVERIDVDIFDVAFNIIGGGEEGGKKDVHTKEEADHSLPYILAAAILDKQVLPAQYAQERINQPDIQRLLQRINIHPSKEYSQRFPEEMPCKITVTLQDAQELVMEKHDYEGFFTRPMQWETVIKKFDALSQAAVSEPVRRKIQLAVENLDFIQTADLVQGLAEVEFAYE
jgi:2-methylcitrate dehydratase